MTQITFTYCFLLLTVLFALQGYLTSTALYLGCFASIVAGVLEHFIFIPGVLLLLTLLLACKVYYANSSSQWLKLLSFLVLMVIAFGLAIHELPGFKNYQIFSKVDISNLSKPYTAYLNIDKVLAGLLIFITSPLLVQPRIDKRSLLTTLQVFLAAVIVLLAPGLLIGYIKFDVKIPDILPYWMVVNYFFVCFSEEVLYRGLLQKFLHDKLHTFVGGAYLAIGIAAILFGLSHYRDGYIFMCLAALAGLFYGYVYYRTQRIKCAMLVHFGVNLTHILLFTYPAARLT